MEVFQEPVSKVTVLTVWKKTAEAKLTVGLVALILEQDLAWLMITHIKKKNSNRGMVINLKPSKSRDPILNLIAPLISKICPSKLINLTE